MIRNNNIKEYIKIKSEWESLILNRINLTKPLQTSLLINFIVNEIKLDINNESHVEAIFKYIDNWNYRNSQTRLSNFFLPIEETIIKAIVNDIDVIKKEDVNIFSINFANCMKVLLNFKNDPSIVNFLEYGSTYINLKFIKKLLNLLIETTKNIQLNYETWTCFINYFTASNKFTTKHKYLFQYIINFDFVYENEHYIVNNHKKIRISFDEIKGFVKDLFDLVELFVDSIIKQLNLLKNYELEMKY